MPLPEGFWKSAAEALYADQKAPYTSTCESRIDPNHEVQILFLSPSGDARS